MQRNPAVAANIVIHRVLNAREYIPRAAANDIGWFDPGERLIGIVRLQVLIIYRLALLVEDHPAVGDGIGFRIEERGVPLLRFH